MAGPVYIPNWLLIVVHATSEGSQRALVLSYKYSNPTPPTPLQLAVVAQTFWTWAGGALKAIAGPHINFDSIEVTDKAAAGGASGSYAIPQPAPGIDTTNGAPGNAALVITWLSGYTGRSHRGRSFTFGMTQLRQIGSLVTSGYVSSVSALASTIANFTGTGAVPLIFSIASRKHLYLTGVLTWVVNAFVDSQRRRLMGRGA